MGINFNPNPTTFYNLLTDLRFHKKYVTSTLGVTSLGSYLNTIPSSQFFGKLFNSPNEFLVSVRAYPFDLKKLNVGTMSNTNLYLGVEDSGISMKTFNMVKPSLNLGTIHINPKYYDYLDYAPFTKITVWLPYIAYVELDTNQVMDRTLSFDYAIDLDSGEVTAVISIIDDGDPYVIKTVNGKIGIDVPIGSTNAREIQKQLFSSTLGIAGSVATAVATKGVSSTVALTQGIKATKDMTNALQTHYHKGDGSMQGMNNMPLPQSVYVFIERNRRIYTFKNSKGKPLMQQKTLSSLHGYTEVNKFLDSMDFGTATKDEVDEIKNLLIGGVYLP